MLHGINEHNHASIDIMMEKMLEDLPQLPEETALQYAVSIRNCSMYVHGFTPAQLATGQNPRLPSALSDVLAALEKPQALLLLNILIQTHPCKKSFCVSSDQCQIEEGSEEAYQELL